MNVLVIQLTYLENLFDGDLSVPSKAVHLQECPLVDTLRNWKKRPSVELSA